MLNSIRTFSLLAGCWLLALPAIAQDGVPPVFSDVVDVRVVNFEVVVTRGGERVAGLGPENFRLLVDGREVPIEMFTEVADGRASVPVDAMTASVGDLRSDEEVGTRYLVFVDDFFTLPAYRNRILRKLGDQLDALTPADSLALVAFDGRRLDMLTSWTSSPSEIKRALREAEDRPAFGLQRLSEQRRFSSTRRFYGSGRSFSGVGFGGSSFSSSAFGAEELFRGKEIETQVRGVVSAATSALRAFAKPPGRKVMLLLSGGWPSAGDNWLIGNDDRGRLYGGLSNSQRTFSQLIDTANRVGYTLYPVDVPGVQRLRGRGAENGSLREAELANEIGRGREINEENTLLYLAETTGGKAFLDGSSLSLLDRASDDTRSYYWLGFTPDWQQNDRRYKVKVELVGVKGKVRSRTSFSDLSRETETTMQMESAQLFQAPLVGGDLQVEIGEGQRTGLGKILLPIELVIPADEITLLPTARGYEARLELRVAVQSERGDRSEIPMIPVLIRGDGAPEAGQVIRYETVLKLRRQQQELLITLTDSATGDILSTRYDYRP